MAEGIFLKAIRGSVATILPLIGMAMAHTVAIVSPKSYWNLPCSFSITKVRKEVEVNMTISMQFGMIIFFYVTRHVIEQSHYPWFT